MKKIILIVLSLTIFLSVAPVTEASASTGLAAMQVADSIDAFEDIIRDTRSLKEQAEMLDALDKYEKESFLGVLYVRVKYCDTIADFKELFEEKYPYATLYMNWEDGYPYVTNVSENGASLVVKTDISGWVYIVSVPDDISGAITDEYSLMKLYNSGSGVYTKRVWVTGGLQKTITVSSSGASGTDYRIYYCIKTGTNYSGFGVRTYTSE